MSDVDFGTAEPDVRLLETHELNRSSDICMREDLCSSYTFTATTPDNGLPVLRPFCRCHFALVLLLVGWVTTWWQAGADRSSFRPGMRLVA
jgi:hypothetical protein